MSKEVGAGGRFHIFLDSVLSARYSVYEKSWNFSCDLCYRRTTESSPPPVEQCYLTSIYIALEGEMMPFQIVEGFGY